MKIAPIDSTIPPDSARPDPNIQRQLRSQLLTLGQSTGLKFEVVRDSTTQRFVVQVLDPDTGDLIDQIPAESILKGLTPDKGVSASQGPSTDKALSPGQ